MARVAKKLKNSIDIEKELEYARQALFRARNIREVRAIQRKIFYLENLLKKKRKIV